MSTQLRAALSEVAGRYIADEDVPGASMAIVRGEAIAAAHVGTRDGSQAEVADGRTLYRIASISKTLTAAAVLGLRDAGRITLDGPVVDHIPELTAVENPFGAASDITIRMLLQHTSGLQGEPPADMPGPWRPIPIEETVARLDRSTVVIAPGSAFKYSNLGFDLLGALVERVTGTSYAAHVRRTVLEPLGMTDTTLDPADVPARLRAVGFDPRDPSRPGAPLRRAIDHGPTAGQAAGGWWSSLDDLVRWLAAQLVPRGAVTGLTPRSLDEMHRPAVATDDQGGYYGLGWRIARRGGRTIVGHGGVTYGFEAIAGFDPEAGAAVVALANGIPATGSMVRLRERLFDLVGNGPGAVPSRRVPSRRVPSTRVPSTREAAAARAGTAAGEHAADDRFSGTFREVGFRNDVAIGPGPVLVEANGTMRQLRATDDPLRYVVVAGRAAGESLRLLPDAVGVVTALELGGYYFTRIPEHTEDE